MMVATLGIALPEIRQTFSLSTIAAGSLFSVMMIIAALTSGIAGRLADKIGRKTVLITGLSLLALGFGLAGVSGHPILFFFFLALTGIGYGFTPPSLYAIMSDLLPNRRGLGASLVSVSYGTGGAIGAVLASRIIATFGWRAAFLTVGSIAAADMLLQLYWIRRHSFEDEPPAMLVPSRTRLSLPFWFSRWLNLSAVRCSGVAPPGHRHCCAPPRRSHCKKPAG